MLTHRALLAAVLLCVTGQVLYHALMRGMPKSISPMFVLGIAYGVGIAAVLLISAFQTYPSGLDKITPAAVLRAAGLGLAIAFVELGYIYAYRQGLPVSVGAITVMAVTTLALVPVGMAFFREGLTLRLLLGLVFTIVGLWLMSSVPRTPDSG
jgi:drug/metabolite transporter (DMT)-like permease